MTQKTPFTLRYNSDGFPVLTGPGIFKPQGVADHARSGNSKFLCKTLTMWVGEELVTHIRSDGTESITKGAYGAVVKPEEIKNTPMLICDLAESCPRKDCRHHGPHKEGCPTCTEIDPCILYLPGIQVDVKCVPVTKKEKTMPLKLTNEVQLQTFTHSKMPNWRIRIQHTSRERITVNISTDNGSYLDLNAPWVNNNPPTVNQIKDLLLNLFP